MRAIAARQRLSSPALRDADHDAHQWRPLNLAGLRAGHRDWAVAGAQHPRHSMKPRPARGQSLREILARSSRGFKRRPGNHQQRSEVLRRSHQLRRPSRLEQRHRPPMLVAVEDLEPLPLQSQRQIVISVRRQPAPRFQKHEIIGIRPLKPRLILERRQIPRRLRTPPHPFPVNPSLLCCLSPRSYRPAHPCLNRRRNSPDALQQPEHPAVFQRPKPRIQLTLPHD